MLRESQDHALKNLAGHLSTRQLIRIAARMKSFQTEDAYSMLEETFMAKFLPPLTRKSLEKTIIHCGIFPLEGDLVENGEQNIKCEVNDGVLTIGK